MDNLLATWRDAGLALTTEASLWPDHATERSTVRQAFTVLAEQTPLAGPRAKPFLVKINRGRDEGRAAMATLAEALTPLMATYAGVDVRIYRTDMLITPPSTAARRMSQHWHRDGEADIVPKAFWLLRDTDETCGPTEYVRASHKGQRLDLCPPRHYPKHPLEVDDALVMRAVGPAGTVALCDTGGVHRGGFSTGGTRWMVMLTWLPTTAWKSAKAEAA